MSVEQRDVVMRVLHVIPSVSERSGGPAMAIVPMCRALQELGIEVTLATTGYGLTQKGTDCIVDYKGLATRFFPVQLGDSFKYSRPLKDWLNKSVKAFDVVHIHAVFNHASVAAARACRRSGVPYIVRPLGTLDPWSMKQKPLRKRLFWLLSAKTMLQRSAAVHYTAAAEKSATEEYLGLNHGSVIPLGVEVNGSPANQVPGQSYILVLSRLHSKKNLEVLIDAFKSLKQNKWRLIIAGDGQPDYVAVLKQKAGDAENIIFTGWVEGEQKEALLRGASLLALPSRQENFGLCVLEAMAHGVPVLVSPNVNLAAEIEAAEAGWVIDVGQLAQGLALILKEEEERERRGRAAYQFSQRYSWQRTAAELAELYRQILSNRALRNGSATLH
ncbi:MAG TPA: glycosyltransferase [Pyrinomonadaceae bacterium]